MSVKDMIKKSVLESGVFDSFNAPKMAISLIVALLLGAVIYMVYSKFYVGVIFSRSFAVTLVGMTLLTCMVTLAISTNIVISLGMVGALSIVRFRTAVKDPMDDVFDGNDARHIMKVAKKYNFEAISCCGYDHYDLSVLS